MSTDPYALSKAILKSVGIDPASVSKVVYEHDAYSDPHLTVTVAAWNVDLDAFEDMTTRYKLTEIPKATTT